MLGRSIFRVMILIFLVGFFSIAHGNNISPIKPSQKDKCPVCGMFVAKYPDWIAEIIFKDGKTVFFDGSKDLFKFYFNMEKYNPGKGISDIQAIYVTEYYDVTYINAVDAFFVTGSDVYGPMGRELIPLKNEADSQEFIKDHQGKQIFNFSDITPEIIASLDQ